MTAVEIPGGPTQAGVTDESSTTAIEVHTEDGQPVSPTTGKPMKQQVVQLEEKRGLAVLIEVMERMDRRMARIEEALTGFVAE